MNIAESRVCLINVRPEIGEFPHVYKVLSISCWKPDLIVSNTDKNRVQASRSGSINNTGIARPGKS